MGIEMENGKIVRKENIRKLTVDEIHELEIEIKEMGGLRGYLLEPDILFTYRKAISGPLLTAILKLFEMKKIVLISIDVEENGYLSFSIGKWE